jgi:hypothetical protein
MTRRLIKSYDPLQRGYSYYVNSKAPKREDFKPDLTPYMCLRLGIFGGSYFAGYRQFLREFPHLDHTIWPGPSADVNFYGVLASMSRREWVQRGWMHDDDPRGWFQWYCRYDMGRRHADDDRQIARWNAFKIRKLRAIGDDTNPQSQPKTRQGLLHWGIRPPGLEIY